MIQTRSATLDKSLNTKLPPLLFHYTSPTGLIGIMKDKEIWATHTTFLSDSKELEHASDQAKVAIQNLLRREAWDREKQLLLSEMERFAGSAAPRFYVASFSEERDLLSQWRAYCPKQGGYSIGFPSAQLAAVGKNQGFFIAKCVYDYSTQDRIAQEIVMSFVQDYRSKRSVTGDNKRIMDRIVWEFYQYIAQFGAVLKHPSFAEEREWRLISSAIDECDERVEFRAGPSSVVPYFRFQLTDAENPNLAKREKETLVVVVGPTPNPSSAQVGVQFLLSRYIGGAAHGASSTPYRTW